MMALLSPRLWLALALALALVGINFVSYRAGKANVQARWNIDKLVVAEAVLRATNAARAKEQELQATVTKAQNDAQKRQKILAADAGRARDVADSVRDELTAVRASLPGFTRAAVDSYATAATIVFEQCSRRYSDLAAVTDGLASDRQTLIEAWPKP